jgi:hypothetical protein
MENEYVYFITNPYYDKNIIKIGWTKKNPIIRIKTLSNPTGVPGSFNIEYIIKTHYGMGYNLEQQIHKYLKKYRINKQREFFRIDKEELANILVNDLNLEIIYVSINNTEEHNTEEHNTEEHNTEENNITNNEQCISINQNPDKFSCNICKYYTNNIKDYNNHLDTIKHMNRTKYVCENCHYYTSRKSQYNRHILTDKHKNIQNPIYKKNYIEKKFICNCGKSYKHSSTLYAHKKTCNIKNITNNNNTIIENNMNDKEIINMLMKDNNDIKNILFEQQNMMIKMVQILQK